MQREEHGKNRKRSQQNKIHCASYIRAKQQQQLMVEGRGWVVGADMVNQLGYQPQQTSKQFPAAPKVYNITAQFCYFRK